MILHVDGFDEMIDNCYFTTGVEGEWKVTIPSYARKGLLQLDNPEMPPAEIQWEMAPTVPVKFIVQGPPPGSGKVYMEMGPFVGTAPKFELEPDGILQWSITLDLTIGETFYYSYFDGTNWTDREYNPDHDDLVGTTRLLPVGDEPLEVHDFIHAWEETDPGYTGRLAFAVTDAATGTPLMQARAHAGGRAGVSDHTGVIVLEGIQAGIHSVTVRGPDETWRPVAIEAQAVTGDPSPVDVALEQTQLVTFTLQAQLPVVEEGQLVPDLVVNLHNMPGPYDGLHWPPPHGFGGRRRVPAAGLRTGRFHAVVPVQRGRG